MRAPCDAGSDANVPREGGDPNGWERPCEAAASHTARAGQPAPKTLLRHAAIPRPLIIEAVDVGYVVLVRVTGELDIATAPQLATVLRPLQARPCDLDLAHVAFMDSAGLALLLAHQRHAEAAGGSLRTIDPSPAVRHILALTATTALLLAAPGPLHP